MKPYRSIDGIHYGRLFPPGKRPTQMGGWFKLISVLVDLAKEMKDDSSRPSGRDIGIHAGYTYFGQFVDHDLTNDVTSLGDVASQKALEGAGWEPEQITNRQTPHLDLSHLYGNDLRGPYGTSAFLYEPGTGRLRVGAPVRSTVRRTAPADRSIDVALDAKDAKDAKDPKDPKDPKSRPLVADRRATENIILRQLTAVFARLHNLAVEQWQGQTNGVADVFKRARLQTAWQFQWLVVNDYLATILHPDVYQRVFVEESPRFEWTKPDVFCIPIEFSVAAMRFGHSMVREAYSLSDDTDASLAKLLDVASEPGPLPADFEVDWARFFRGAGRGALATTAQPIDTLISEGMFHIPFPILRLFNNADIPSFAKEKFHSLTSSGIPLPFITLLRGAAMGLPSGQAVAEAFAVPKLSELALTRGIDGKVSRQGQVLLDHALTESTPLWYYLLREAEVNENGNHLGKTASNIIAETISGALDDDAESYVHLPKSTTMPPMWESGGVKRQFRSLSALLEAAPDFP